MAKNVEELLKECIERLNAIDLNAKKIDELPHQTALQTLSKLHVSNQGTSEYLEVQQIVDAVTALTYDRIVSIGTIVLSGNTITIPENAQWVITNVNYSNVLPIALNSPFAANGLARKDIIVANKFNSMTLIRGTETAGITIRPNIPIDTVLVTEMDVTDSNIGNILLPNTSTNGIVTTRRNYDGTGVTDFKDYIDNLPPFTVAVNEILYFEDSESNDIVLFLQRGGTYGQGYPSSTRGYLKFKGGSSTQLRREPFIYTSGAQEFTLPESVAQIVLVTVNGGAVYDYTVLSDTLVRIDLPLVPTVRVVIHYLVDLNLDTAPYYTQAQVDGIASDKVDKVAGKVLSMNDFTDALKTAYDNVVSWIATNGANLINHLSDKANPHEVTKAQIGLGNVPNTDFTNSKQDTLTEGAGISIIGSTISATGTTKTKGIITATNSSGSDVVLSYDLNEVVSSGTKFVVLPTITETGEEIYVYAENNATFFTLKANQAGTNRLSGNGISSVVGSIDINPNETYRFVHRGSGYWYYERVQSTVVSSGEYTGTLTNVTNIASSTFIHAFWNKIGIYTSVSFAFEAFPTMTGVCVLHLTTPTNIDGSIIGSLGHGTFYGAFGFAVPMIVQFESATKVRIFFNATSLNQGVANGSFTYK